MVLENSSRKEAARKGSSKEADELAGQPGDHAYSLGDGQGQRSDLTDWEFMGGKVLETASARSTLEESRCCEVTLWWTQSDDCVVSQSPISGIRQR